MYEEQDFKHWQWRIEEGISDKADLTYIVEGMKIGRELANEPEKFAMLMDAALDRIYSADKQN